MIERDLTGLHYILNFQYVAVLVMSLMLVYMLVERLLFLRKSRLFFIVILLSLGSTAFDILRATSFNQAISIYNETQVINRVYLNLANIFSVTYLILLFAALFMFVMYAIEITCGFGFIHKNKIRASLFYLPIFFAGVLLFLSYFVNILYKYEFNGSFIMQFNIGWLLTIIIIPLAYLIMSFVLAIVFRKVFERKQLYALALVLPLMTLGLVTEIVVPRLLVLAFLTSICIVLILTILEASEDVMDSNTKLYSNDEFVKKVKKIFIVKGSHICLLVRINNYSELLKAYDLDEVSNYTLDVTNRIKRERKTLKIKFHMYSLNNGYYAAIFDSKAINQISNGLRIGLKSEKYCHDFIPDYDGCLISFVNDFENPDDVISFVNNFRQTIKFKDSFTIYSNVKDDKNLIIANHLEQIIDTALEENEFEVYYQPIYSIETGKFKTAEALVRLISKKYGFISPASFIPYAENAGRIEEIDSFVMEEVFKFVSSEKFTELELDYIEINLSMAECINPHLIERVKLLMEKYNVDPRRVNLEITESFDASEQGLINHNLNILHEMGFRFALDDYGTGYSNISRFSSLPISIVKIDKSLVDECEDKDVMKILDYSFNIVKDLNKETVVEGVETEKQLEKFKKYGATYIQGYYFSKPLDFESYVDFVKKNNR